MTSSHPALPVLSSFKRLGSALHRFFLKAIKYECLCHLSPPFPLNTSDSMWGPGGLQDVQDGGFQPPVRTATQKRNKTEVNLKGFKFERFLIDVKGVLNP